MVASTSKQLLADYKLQILPHALGTFLDVVRIGTGLQQGPHHAPWPLMQDDDLLLHAVTGIN